MDIEMKDPGGAVSPAARKKRETLPSAEEQEKTRKQKGRPGVRSCTKHETMTGR